MLDETVRLFIAPLVAGTVIAFLFHEGIGHLAIFFIRDKKKFTEFQQSYIDIMFKLKDIFYLWAIGTLIRIAIGY